MSTDITISLIISTYNWPEALELVLESVKKQTILPHEVIIADDGSGAATKELIKSFQQNFPVPIIHSWQEDLGFRQSSSKNKAIVQSSGDFLVCLDGDLVLHKKFVEDSLFWAEKDTFFFTTRAYLPQKVAATFFETRELPKNIFWYKKMKNRKNQINSRLLSKLSSPKRSQFYPQSVRGGLMGIWRDMLLKVNGFNEDFEGWGREDSELYVRLFYSGFKRRDVKFNANTYHLFHEIADRSTLSTNDEKLQAAIDEKRIWCDNGITNYLPK